MRKFIAVVVAVMFIFPLCACIEEKQATPKSTSGVRKATVKVKTGADGLTVEQRNVARRLVEDTKIGAVKHLYVISAYSGQTIIYSTVKGKVTSSTKRLTPKHVAAIDGQYIGEKHYGLSVNIGGEIKRTPEVLGDDGTYGSSIKYLYWWDSKDVFHQHYISGGQIVHVSSEPLSVKSIIINVEQTTN